MKKITDFVSISEFNPRTILFEDTSFDGVLHFEKPLEIRGKFKGKIHSKSVLLINQSACIEGDVKANIVIVAGTVKGNVEGLIKVDILSTGKLYGDIKTAKLKIADGVIFEGSCHMMK
ncbi:MAG: polymer-forming cytoskeletal protein [Spirochaetes bacterium]|nr:polymer-forming cytoskeletal protein [Spirochaetota bacterium]